MFLTGGFESVLRGIAIVLCNWIYGLIPNLFSIFYYLADSMFINSEIIKLIHTPFNPNVFDNIINTIGK